MCISTIHLLSNLHRYHNNNIKPVGRWLKLDGLSVVLFSVPPDDDYAVNIYDRGGEREGKENLLCSCVLFVGIPTTSLDGGGSSSR